MSRATTRSVWAVLALFVLATISITREPSQEPLSLVAEDPQNSTQEPTTTTECAPRADDKFFVLHYHKTGHDLSRAVFSALELAKENPPKRRPLNAAVFDSPSRVFLSAGTLISNELPSNVHLVHFTRDPIWTIVSGAVYHSKSPSSEAFLFVDNWNPCCECGNSLVARAKEVGGSACCPVSGQKRSVLQSLADRVGLPKRMLRELLSVGRNDCGRIYGKTRKLPYGKAMKKMLETNETAEFLRYEAYNYLFTLADGFRMCSIELKMRNQNKCRYLHLDLDVTMSNFDEEISKTRDFVCRSSGSSCAAALDLGNVRKRSEEFKTNTHVSDIKIDVKKRWEKILLNDPIVGNVLRYLRAIHFDSSRVQLINGSVLQIKPTPAAPTTTLRPTTSPQS